eukprot:6620248-Alexandrium_andersonii.AAC.1
MDRGVLLTTSFSGMGTAELAAGQLGAAFAGKGGFGVAVCSSCDCNKPCVDVLRACGAKLAATPDGQAPMPQPLVFTNVLDRPPGRKRSQWRPVATCGELRFSVASPRSVQAHVTHVGLSAV